MSKKFICICGRVRTKESCSACGHHTSARKKDLRGTSNERGYDYRWNKFSKWFREMNPLCHDCSLKGHTRPSAEVHHIIKLRDKPSLKYDLDNLMALCSDCHRIRTARGE